MQTVNLLKKASIEDREASNFFINDKEEERIVNGKTLQYTGGSFTKINETNYI